MNTTQGLFCVVTVLYWFSLYTYVPILPVYASSLGASYKLVGLIVGGSAGHAIVYFACASIVGAALVLATGGTKYFRAAFVQGITPLIALILAAVL